MELTKSQIDIALPKVKEGLAKYQTIQALYKGTNINSDRDFQRKFNHFYRVRRGQDWQKPFYELLEKAKYQDLTFEGVLEELARLTGRLEASFSSKLLATVYPDKAILDSVVLKNLGLKLPYAGAKNRQQKIVSVFEALDDKLVELLKSEIGDYLVDRFTAMYPKSGITKIKMLDLVLWQIR